MYSETGLASLYPVQQLETGLRAVPYIGAVYKYAHIATKPVVCGVDVSSCLCVCIPNVCHCMF